LLAYEPSLWTVYQGRRRYHGLNGATTMKVKMEDEIEEGKVVEALGATNTVVIRDGAPVEADGMVAVVV
jgi:hypothetical protein